MTLSLNPSNGVCATANLLWCTLRFRPRTVSAISINGFRYIYYTSAATSALGDSTYVHHGLGAALHDGNWHTLVRNLEQDLKEAQPDNELQSILGFLIRGSGKVDDVQTR